VQQLRLACFTGCLLLGAHDAYYYRTFIAGSVLLESFSDPHNQCSLRGHDQDISCLAMEPSGRLAAAGQGGENADVTVWNLKTKQLLYRLCEHDIRVVCVSFSHDGKLLCSVGCADDNKLVIWDMSTGAIVTASRLAPMPIECIAWGGMVLDIKGRPTRHYQLATSGAKKVNAG
jgi:WD40 repeat protein